jgi:anti-anti-sigma factor
MLKISLIEPQDSMATLQLAGKVSGPWVEELRKSCEHMLAQRTTLTLDLSDVSFVDSKGIRLLRSLRDRHVALLHCSPFVAEQIRG